MSPVQTPLSNEAYRVMAPSPLTPWLRALVAADALVDAAVVVDDVGEFVDYCARCDPDAAQLMGAQYAAPLRLLTAKSPTLVDVVSLLGSESSTHAWRLGDNYWMLWREAKGLVAERAKRVREVASYVRGAVQILCGFQH